MHVLRCHLLLLSALLGCGDAVVESSHEPLDTRQESLAGRRGPRRDAGRCPEPEPPPACLFGSQFSDLRTNGALAIASEQWITSEAAQLVLAVQQSSHTDVTTPGEALARVDQQEVRLMELVETAGERAFTVYEYGVGDNSYGALFTQGTTELVAHIHDGDLLDCTVYSGG